MPRSRACPMVLPFALAVVTACSMGSKDSKPAESAAAGAFTEEFGESDADFESIGTNPWFVLRPGDVLVLQSLEDGRAHRLDITVLDETEKIAGVETRVVEERESVAGEVVEVSRNYFAISKRTNSVYYFGEDVDLWKHGKVVGHEGSWRAGVNGARYGLAMPGRPQVGQRYAQEIAPRVAMDRAEVVSVDAKIAGLIDDLDHLLEIEETTPLEPGSREKKYYEQGVGIVRDGALQIVQTESAERR